MIITFISKTGVLYYVYTLCYYCITGTETLRELLELIRWILRFHQHVDCVVFPVHTNAGSFSEYNMYVYTSIILILFHLHSCYT
jgi:hypothetical protein